jgi:hypothetical protein
VESKDDIVEGEHDGKYVTAVVALAQKRVNVQRMKAPERMERGRVC